MKLKTGPLPQAREWDRLDPEYDRIRPIEVIAMFPIAIVTVIAFLVAVGFLFAVLAPES